MSLKLNSTAFGTKVWIARSGEAGTVTAYSQHMRCKQKQFLVEYVAADGRAVSDWFTEDQLTTFEP